MIEEGHWFLEVLVPFYNKIFSACPMGEDNNNLLRPLTKRPDGIGNPLMSIRAWERYQPGGI